MKLNVETKFRPGDLAITVVSAHDKEPLIAQVLDVVTFTCPGGTQVFYETRVHIKEYRSLAGDTHGFLEGIKRFREDELIPYTLRVEPSPNE